MSVKKCICLLCVLALAISLAACGKEEKPTQTTAAPTDPVNTQTLPAAEVPVDFMIITMNETVDKYVYMTAEKSEDGTARIEYDGQEKKVGHLEETSLYTLASALEYCGLAAQNGRSEFTEGEAAGSIFVSFADGSSIAADFTGTLPREFVDGYRFMEKQFQELTADLPVYVPQAEVMGRVDETALGEMQEILNHSGMKNLDGLMIEDIPVDEYFAGAVGLSGSDGIANATRCSAMMMTTPYSLVIVTLEDVRDAESVAKDFEASLDWQKWVCVSPEYTLIALKGNMVLCLMGSETMFAQTASSAKNAGWTEIKTLKNPNW